MALWAVITATATAEWETLRDCRLLPNDFNDGDSFHVEANGEEKIFRLYFADTPESSDQVPERVAEQAAHFGVSEREVMHAGKEAAEFTKRVLHRPFTVTTRWQNARGASALPRYYAVITTADGKDLAELLVGAGLARAHGAVADAPRTHGMDHYEALEQRARRAAVGIFGHGKMPSGSIEETASETKPAPSPAPTPEEVKSLTDDVFARLQQESASNADIPEFVVEVPLPAGHAPVSRTNDDQTSPTETAANGTKISINAADKAELESLPGIGPGLAEAIIRGRPYNSVDQLKRVPGIGPKKFEQMKNLLRE